MTKDVLVVRPLGDDRVPGADRHDLGRIDHFAHVVRRQPRTEHLQQLPLGRNPLDRAAGAGHLALQFERGVAADFDARCSRWRQRTVAPRRRPEIRPTSPKIEPCWIGTTLLASLPDRSRTFTAPSAMANSEEPGSAFSKIVSPALSKPRIRIEHELTQLQRRHAVQDGDIGAQQLQPVVHAALARQPWQTSLRARARPPVSDRCCH